MRYMEGRMRTLFLVGGLAALVLTIGFYFQMSLATRLWMWLDGRLTYIFIASITAAIAAPLIWMALSGEWGAAVGGAINLTIQAGGIAIFLALISINDNLDYWPHILFIAAFALINVWVYF